MLTTVPRDYSFIAPIYDQIFDKVLSEGHKKIGSLLRSKKSPQLKVLEVGVGSGLTLDYLPNRIEYCGIDINNKMLSLAHSRADRYPRKKISLALMDAHKLTYKNNSFDIVMAASVISAVEDPSRVMKEMIRVTKKGGEIAVIANVREDSYKSKIIKRFDPLTKKLLGFRTDLDNYLFQSFTEIELIETQQVNNLLGFPLSTYMLFRKN
jgi:phosphatidylethanolamine/phosphatidyl-N-methylethanolamine N-methyltransferase